MLTQLQMLGVALERGRLADGKALAVRLVSLCTDKMFISVDDTLRSNELPPTQACRLDEMPEGSWAFLSQNCGLVERTSLNCWVALDSQTSQRTRYKGGGGGGAESVLLVPSISQWGDCLYSRLDDALHHRKSNQHIVSLEYDEEKRRYLCTAAEAELDEVLRILAKRPLCDRSLASCMLAGFGVRIMQWDIEAMLDVNPALATPAAQRDYVALMLQLFTEFRGGQPLPWVTLFGSDATKFSNRTYIVYDFGDFKHHDDTLLAFLEWLSAPEQVQRSQPLLINKGQPPVLQFALDALATGCHRIMRFIGFPGKGGKCRFPLPSAYTLADMIRFAFPNDLRCAAVPVPLPVHEVWAQQQGTGKRILLKDSSGRPPLENTFLYLFPFFPFLQSTKGIGKTKPPPPPIFGSKTALPSAMIPLACATSLPTLPFRRTNCPNCGSTSAATLAAPSCMK
jgi:hypothetical protein